MMRQYLDLLQHILNKGVKKTDRTGTGTLSVFGYQMRFNLSEGFPLLTTKKIHYKSMIYELLWFLRGDTNVRWLQERGVTIWDQWADKNGELGPVYGAQWRSWPNWVLVPGRAGNPDWIPDEMVNKPIDQIKEAVQLLKKDPDSRRIVVSAWNVGELSKMALMPCHALFQFYVADGKLSCQLYQRSCDTFIGVPFNIASYALLTMMFAQVCGYEPGEFIWTGGDVHLYLNHLEQAKLQLLREPRALPRMEINPEGKDIFKFSFEDFKLTGYDDVWPSIKAPIAV